MKTMLRGTTPLACAARARVPCPCRRTARLRGALSLRRDVTESRRVPRADPGRRLLVARSVRGAMSATRTVDSNRTCHLLINPHGKRTTTLHASTRAHRQLPCQNHTLHVTPVTASCATKPAAASIANRQCASSFSCMARNSIGSSGANRSGSNARSPG